MRNIIKPGVDVDAFVRDASIHNYSLASDFLDPSVAAEISGELSVAGYLEDLVELEPTSTFDGNRMKAASQLRRILNGAICRVENKRKNYLPFFSVRVFEPGMYGTTVHRNHPAIGPWAIGITLSGEAPFSVYGQDLLPKAWDQTIELEGKATDPEPFDSINTSPGAAWILNTTREQTPHSGGFVNSETPRELLILYGYKD